MLEEPRVVSECASVDDHVLLVGGAEIVFALLHQECSDPPHPWLEHVEGQAFPYILSEDLVCPHVPREGSSPLPAPQVPHRQWHAPPTLQRLVVTYPCIALNVQGLVFVATD
eukprot:1016727-Rhodomonas_salina.2